MSDPRQQRAWAALQMHQYDLARREAAAVLASDPENQFIRLILGEACMRLGDYPAGREQAAELLRLAPDWGWGHWLLAWSLLLDRRHEVFQKQTTNRLHQAGRAAQQALECDPNQTAFFEIAAAVAMEAGDNRQAMQLIDRGLNLNPNCQFLQRLKGQVFSATRDPSRATEAFLGSLSLAPEDHLSHRELARSLFASGRYRASREHIQEAMRLDPNDEEARHLMLTVNQTQHWLLRSAMWFHQSTRFIRVWFPLWVFVTVLAGLPLVVWAEDPARPKWLVWVVYGLWMFVVWLPLTSLVLPLVTNMLWVIIGRDTVQRALTWQERWDRLAPGLVVLTSAPVIIASAALQSIVLPSIYVMLIVLALLQSGAAARAGPIWKSAVAAAAVVYLSAAIVLLKQAALNQLVDVPEGLGGYVNFHVFTLLGAFIGRIVAGAVRQ